jgi:hypothetical protein
MSRHCSSDTRLRDEYNTICTTRLDVHLAFMARASQLDSWGACNYLLQGTIDGRCGLGRWKKQKTTSHALHLLRYIHLNQRCLYVWCKVYWVIMNTCIVLLLNYALLWLPSLDISVFFYTRNLKNRESRWLFKFTQPEIDGVRVWTRVRNLYCCARLLSRILWNQEAGGSEHVGWPITAVVNYHMAPLSSFVRQTLLGSLEQAQGDDCLLSAVVESERPDG